MLFPWRNILAASALALSLAGCVVVQEPALQTADLVAVPGLAGDWIFTFLDKEKTEQVARISVADDRLAHVTLYKVTDGDLGKKSEYRLQVLNKSIGGAYPALISDSAASYLAAVARNPNEGAGNEFTWALALFKKKDQASLGDLPARMAAAYGIEIKESATGITIKGPFTRAAFLALIADPTFDGAMTVSPFGVIKDLPPDHPYRQKLARELNPPDADGEKSAAGDTAAQAPSKAEASQPEPAGPPPSPPLAAQQAYLAGMDAYAHGDFIAAIAAFRKATADGHPQAQYAMGIIHERGEGVAKDDAVAATWYEKAAQQGVADAQFALGLAYYRGRGVTKDAALATAWLTKAAAQGHKRAEETLKMINELSNIDKWQGQLSKLDALTKDKERLEAEKARLEAEQQRLLDLKKKREAEQERLLALKRKSEAELRELCGGRICSILKDGRTIYRTDTYDPPRWYFEDGRIAPRELWK